MAEVGPPLVDVWSQALLSISSRCSHGGALLEVMLTTQSRTGLRTQSCVTATFHSANWVTNLGFSSTGETFHGR